MQLDECKIRDFLSKHSLYEFIRELFYRLEKWPELKKCGYLYVIKWLNSNIKENWDTSVFELLVRENALSALKFLKNNGHQINVSESEFIQACETGKLEMVEFLHQNNNISYIDSPLPMEKAAKYGYVMIVRFLHEKDYKCTSLVMEWAAANNDFSLVDYLNKNNDYNILITKKTVEFLLDSLKECW